MIDELEEKYVAAEKRRLFSEEKLRAVHGGEPLPGTLGEFFKKYGGWLAENPLLKEFLIRLEAEFAEVANSLKNYQLEQNLDVQRLNSEVNALRYQLQTLEDNFNMFMSRIAKNSDERLALVRKAVAAIDNAIY